MSVEFAPIIDNFVSIIGSLIALISQVWQLINDRKSFSKSSHNDHPQNRNTIFRVVRYIIAGLATLWLTAFFLIYVSTNPEDIKLTHCREEKSELEKTVEKLNDKIDVFEVNIASLKNENLVLKDTIKALKEDKASLQDTLKIYDKFLSQHKRLAGLSVEGRFGGREYQRLTESVLEIQREHNFDSNNLNLLLESYKQKYDSLNQYEQQLAAVKKQLFSLFTIKLHVERSGSEDSNKIRRKVEEELREAGFKNLIAGTQTTIVSNRIIYYSSEVDLVAQLIQSILGEVVIDGDKSTFTLKQIRETDEVEKKMSLQVYYKN